MQTRELIENLKKVDPSGLLDVVVDNRPIVGAGSPPAYWDGCYEKILTPFRKYEICANGDKVVLFTLSMHDAMMDDSNLVVVYDSEYAERHYSKVVEQARQSSIDMDNEIEEELRTHP